MSHMDENQTVDGELCEVSLPDLPPADFCDPVIEVYKRDVDRTLLRANLRRTVAERSRRFARSMKMVFELRRAGETMRRGSTGTL